MYRAETGWKRHNLQLRAMFYKRLVQSARNNVITLGQILIPVLFIVIACLVPKPMPKDDKLTNLTLDLTHFESPITPYDVLSSTVNVQSLSSCYNASVLRHGKAVLINSELGYSTMDAYLLSIGKNDKDTYDFNYQIGATIREEPDGKLNITGLFNNQAYHAIAISLSYLGNTLMRCFGNKEHQIQTSNHPLPKNSSQQALQSAKGSGDHDFSPFGTFIFFDVFLLFLIRERKSGAKHSQLVSGVKLLNFWLAEFVWDYVIYLVVSILLTLIILGFRIDGYWQNSW